MEDRGFFKKKFLIMANMKKLILRYIILILLLKDQYLYNKQILNIENKKYKI